VGEQQPDAAATTILRRVSMASTSEACRAFLQEHEPTVFTAAET
jgi:hypothetical protein